MNLTFSRRATLQGIEHNTEFERRIKRGEKIHTIRKGDRWKPGMKIHFWMGTPRNTSSDPQRFFVSLDVADFWIHQWGKEKPVMTTKDFLRMRGLNLFDTPNTEYYLPAVAMVEKIIMRNLRGEWPTVQVGRKALTAAEIVTLSQNDGFDLVEDFFDWFRNLPVYEYREVWSEKWGAMVYKKYKSKKKIDEFEGQIIHWTKLVYDSETASKLSI